MVPKRYRVIIEPTSPGFSAYSPDVPGCASSGDSEEETRQNFQQTLSEHLHILQEIGAPIPEPHSTANYVEVAA